MLRLRRGEGLDGDSEEGVISCKAFCHFSCSVFFYRYSSCSCILPSHNSDSRISAPINATICRHLSANWSNLRRSDIPKRTPKSCRGSSISGSEPTLHPGISPSSSSYSKSRLRMSDSIGPILRNNPKEVCGMDRKWPWKSTCNWANSGESLGFKVGDCQHSKLICNTARLFRLTQYLDNRKYCNFR